MPMLQNLGKWPDKKIVRSYLINSMIKVYLFVKKGEDFFKFGVINMFGLLIVLHKIILYGMKMPSTKYERNRMICLGSI